MVLYSRSFIHHKYDFTIICLEGQHEGFHECGRLVLRYSLVCCGDMVLKIITLISLLLLAPSAIAMPPVPKPLPIVSVCIECNKPVTNRAYIWPGVFVCRRCR